MLQNSFAEKQKPDRRTRPCMLWLQCRPSAAKARPALASLMISLPASGRRGTPPKGLGDMDAA